MMDENVTLVTFSLSLDYIYGTSLPEERKENDDDEIYESLLKAKTIVSKPS